METGKRPRAGDTINRLREYQINALATTARAATRRLNRIRRKVQRILFETDYYLFRPLLRQCIIMEPLMPIGNYLDARRATADSGMLEVIEQVADMIELAHMFEEQYKILQDVAWQYLEFIARGH